MGTAAGIVWLRRQQKDSCVGLGKRPSPHPPVGRLWLMMADGWPITVQRLRRIGQLFRFRMSYLCRNCQKAIEAVWATFRESTPWDMGMQTT